MKNLIDHYSGSDGAAAPALTELRLGAEPAMALLFTPDVDEVSLHYVDDDSLRAYVVCPGTACPVCYAGSKPVQFHLLPVYDIESSTVRVLRIPSNRKPEGLGAKLTLQLKSKDVANTVILLRREGPVYTVEARPLGPDAKRGEAEIKVFLDEVEQGLLLESAFPRMAAEELAEVPKIAKRLAAIGGWQPPRLDDMPGGSEIIDTDEGPTGT